jgi:aspartyl protease family protein
MYIGVDPASLDFTMSVATANGRAAAAPVLLSSVRVGSIVVFDVPAAVAQPGRLQDGILGMTFLERLDETSFQGDQLILRQSVRPLPVAGGGSANQN